MLTTIKLTNISQEFPAECVMLLGGFDGLHAGHKTLVERAKSYGTTIGAMTITGGKHGGDLFTLAERNEIFLRAGVDFVFALPFDEIKDMSPKSFLEMIETRFAPKALICGDDFRFGKDALGSAQTLERYTRVRVETLELLQKDGKKISATTIKDCLAAGDIKAANELLGERFFLLGEVVKDRQIGKTLGFPTANIRYPKEKFPIKKGVYETRVEIGGKTYKGITNYGARPTFHEENESVETYLDGYTGDLYGKTLKVEFVRFMREIYKFPSPDALLSQLKKDVLEIRKDD